MSSKTKTTLTMLIFVAMMSMVILWGNFNGFNTKTENALPSTGWDSADGSVTADAQEIVDEAKESNKVAVAVEKNGKLLIEHTTLPQDNDDAVAVVEHLQEQKDVIALSAAQPTSVSTSNPAEWSSTSISATTVPGNLTGAGIVVAVLDTGVEANHKDLQGVVLNGYDIIAKKAGATTDPHWHGTHVAGIIAAKVGNNYGIDGIAPGAKILPVRVLNSSGAGWSTDAAAGIVWAVDNGADVINMSLTSAEDPVMKTAIEYANSKGTAVVAAAGNLREKGNAARYPAAWKETIAVGAVDKNDSLATFSNTGSYVDLVAPGVSIYSTAPAGSFKTASGTSMATPYVAGVIALMKQANPSLTAAEVLSYLKGSARSPYVGFQADDYFGAGIVNATGSICAVSQLCTATPAPNPTTPTPSAPVTSAPAPSPSPTPSPTTTPVPTPSVTPTPSPVTTTVGSKITVSVNKPYVSVGGKVTFSIKVTDNKNQPIPGARVNMQWVGGLKNDKATQQGTSNNTGIVTWTVAPKSMGRLMLDWAGNQKYTKTSTTYAYNNVHTGLSVRYNSRNVTVNVAGVSGQKLYLQKNVNNRWVDVYYVSIKKNQYVIPTGRGTFRIRVANHGLLKGVNSGAWKS